MSGKNRPLPVVAALALAAAGGLSMWLAHAPFSLWPLALLSLVLLW
ncbi:MAG: hypothetical protein GX483_03460 [Actinomycetaceae bacterium]|nr:hypothetical protein [Actinomycetaceae bacterium]